MSRIEIWLFFSKEYGISGFMKGGDLSLVIPLFNEEAVVEGVVRDLIKKIRGISIDFSLILVNNGSYDRTSSIIHKLRGEFSEISIIDLKRNYGYGGGILEGLEASKGDVVGYMWGDGQIRGDSLINVYERLIEERLDLCKIFRIYRMDGWSRTLISTIYNLSMPLLFDLESRDINGCPKLFTRSAFKRLSLSSRDWFIDAEIMIKAKALGLRYQEVPAVLYPRSGGVSKVRVETLREFMKNIIKYKIMGI